jgi:hypothetical protein
MHSHSIYIPCNAPATSMIGWPDRKEGPYRMCMPCAEHSLKNRGATFMGVYEGVAEPAKPELPPADQIVSRYLELRDYAKQREDEFKAEMAPYKEAMETLAGAADLLMKETGQKALSTENGTAYYSHTLSARCDDPDAFFKFVFDTAQTDRAAAKAYLTTHVGKEAVQTYMDGIGAGHPPAGVKTDMVIRVNFRKS